MSEEGWGSHLLADYLSHNFYPSLEVPSRALVCRAVCRSWRDAFSISSLCLSEGSLSNGLIWHKGVTLKARSLTLRHLTQGDLKQLVKLSPECDLLTSVSFAGQTIFVESFIDFLGLNLRRLTSLSFSSLRPADPTKEAPAVYKRIANALVDSKLRLKDLKFSLAHIGDKAGSILIRGVKEKLTSIQSLCLHGCQLDQMSLAALAELIDAESNLTSLNCRYNGLLFSDAELCESFSSALARNTTLTKFDASDCDLSQFSHLFSSLRSNTTLRELDTSHSSIWGSQLPFIFSCLEENRGLEKFEVAFNSENANTPEALGRFFSRNKCLQHLSLRMPGFSNFDFGAMFEGLMQNTSMKALEFGMVSGRFAEQFGSCLLSSPKLLLTSITMNCDEMGESVCLLIDGITGSACKSSLSSLSLYFVSGTPKVAEALAGLLKASECLELIHLFEPKCDTSFAQDLFLAAKHNKSLRELEIELDSPSSDDDLIDIICDFIANSPVLRVLDFCGSSFQSHHRHRFESALKKNTAMKSLQIKFVKISEDENGQPEVTKEFSGNLCLHFTA